VDTDAAPLVAATEAFSMFAQRQGDDYDVLQSIF
jgi:hypothetical protein